MIFYDAAFFRDTRSGLNRIGRNWTRVRKLLERLLALAKTEDLERIAELEKDEKNVIEMIDSFFKMGKTALHLSYGMSLNYINHGEGLDLPFILKQNGT